jgi:3-oxoacyl-[acyl-carrier protein] reductase
VFCGISAEPVQIRITREGKFASRTLLAVRGWTPISQANDIVERFRMGKLKGKVAIVTGASKGIGAGIARELAASGAAVVVNYASDRDGAARVVADIKDKGGKAVAVKADVSKADDVKRLVKEAVDAFGALDVLVNNAGVYDFAPLGAVTEGEFHRQFNTNVLGLILTAQEAVAHFGADGGSIVNIGSSATARTPANSVVYSATKGAVDAITGVLARELGPKNIRVNSVNPGGVDTEGTRTWGLPGSDFEKQLIAETPLGRIGQPEDIGPVVAFLASDEARWISGETILVSGGMR